MRKVLKINAGIACLDKANEVEPRPNEVPLTVIASRAATWQPKRSGARRSQSLTTNAFLVRDWLRRARKLGCFAALAMTALFRRLRASAHFQFSIFNFQLTKGIACSDRANEVEPRPNEGTPYRHCEGGTTEATEFTSSTQSIQKIDYEYSGLLRGACPEQSVGARNDGVMGCLFGFSYSLFRASAHFQFSIFN